MRGSTSGRRDKYQMKYCARVVRLSAQAKGSDGECRRPKRTCDVTTLLKATKTAVLTAQAIASSPLRPYAQARRDASPSCGTKLESGERRIAWTTVVCQSPAADDDDNDDNDCR
jgi:hypothetical protein